MANFVLRQPVILYETIEAMYQWVNGISVERRKAELFRKYGLLLSGEERERMEAICRCLQQVQDLCAEQPEDPALPYFFGKWETESQWQNICLAKLMVFSFLDIRVTDFQASLDQTLAAAEARFAKPYLLTEVNSGGMSFRTPAEGEEVPSLITQLEQLALGEQYCWRIYKLLQDYPKALAELATLLEPLARRIAPVLAELASFFGVTLDELVGYEPQLGREQIRRIYRELAEDFAKKPFAEVMAVCRRYIRRYGSCWPFLLQMAGLLLNHAPLAPTPEERRDALDEAESLCRRVRERCSDPGLASDASYQEAAAALMRGDAERAAAQLEEMQDPLRLSSQGELLLLQAYQQAGQTEQARGRVQIGEYLLLLNLTASAATDLALSGADVARCDRLLHRTDALIEDWQLAQLHPNISAQYFYQAALTCMELQRPERALPYLRRFADTVAALLCGAPILHGDAFFDRLEPWIARMELGGDAPRRLRLAAQDAVRALRHPAFAPLPADAAFAALEKNLQEEANHVEN